MSKGAKIAIGCGVAAALAVGVVLVLFVSGVYWVKGKAEKVAGSFTAKTEEIGRYEKVANATPFEKPADGVIAEGRLQKFIEVRKDVYQVYEQYKDRFEGAKDRKQPSLSDIAALTGLISDIRLAQMKGLAGVGMSEAEYRFIQMAVYQSAWSAEFQKDTGKPLSEMAAEAAKESKEAAGVGIDKAQQAAEQVKTEAVPKLSPEEAAKLKETMGEFMTKMAEGAKKMEAPQANVELFKKYEADLKKYAMHGLAAFGL